MAVEVAVFELHAPRAAALGDEADLDLDAVPLETASICHIGSTSQPTTILIRKVVGPPRRPTGTRRRRRSRSDAAAAHVWLYSPLGDVDGEQGRADVARRWSNCSAEKPERLIRGRIDDDLVLDGRHRQRQATFLLDRFISCSRSWASVCFETDRAAPGSHGSRRVRPGDRRVSRAVEDEAG